MEKERARLRVARAVEDTSMTRTNRFSMSALVVPTLALAALLCGGASSPAHEEDSGRRGTWLGVVMAADDAAVEIVEVIKDSPADPTSLFRTPSSI